MGVAPNLTGQIPVRAATATPPATAKSRSGPRLQRHLRRPNPGQGHDCNATCGGQIPVRATTATPPAGAKSRSGPRLQRHLRRPNPGQGYDCNATCGGQIPVRAAATTPPAAAESRSGRRLQRHRRRPNPGCISFDTLVFVGHVIFHHICPIVRHDNRYLSSPSA